MWIVQLVTSLAVNGRVFWWFKDRTGLLREKEQSRIFVFLLYIQSVNSWSIL